MSPRTEGIQADDNGGVTEGVPGAVAEGSEKMEGGEPCEQRQLANFPDVVEDQGTQKHIGNDRAVRVSPPAPAQEYHPETYGNHEKKIQHSGNIVGGVARVKRNLPVAMRHALAAAWGSKVWEYSCFSPCFLLHEYNPQDSRAYGMIWHCWHCARLTLSRSQPLIALRVLVFVVFGMMVLGQGLTQGAQVAPLMPAGMGCHDDCWYDKPSWQPIAVLQYVPVLPIPQVSIRFLTPPCRTFPRYDMPRRSLPPRAPPLALHRSRLFST